MRTAFFDGRTPQYRPGPDARLCDPADVAVAVLAAMQLPPDVEIKEMVVGPPGEPSWP
jgi:NADP-dependent 3-hydroxy acid dehydrogenase YdfG